MLHSNLRDCEAWRDIGLPLSTTSNEACKMYDAVLTQWIRWKNIPSFGGIEGCMSKLQAADPDFVMGHVIKNGLDLLGTGRSVLIDKHLDSAVKKMVRLSKARDITERERLHVEALDLFGKGALPKACEVWEDILLYHPTDILAIKLLCESYFFQGKSTELRDSVARILHHWTPQIPLYGYLQGMYSFALVETNFFDRAEKIAKEALASAPSDIWSMHSLAHVHYMRADTDSGITLMKQTEGKWNDCVMSSVHNYWHWALFHIEKGEYEAALTIFDTHIAKSCYKSGSVLEMVDASSLLYQLQMEGINVDDRWKEMSTVTKNQAEDHGVIYGDVHTLISLVAAKETETADKFMTSLREISRSPGDNYQHQLAQRLSLPLCQAITEFADGNYSRTVDLLHPIRYQIHSIGGSKPQVDLFNLLLIHAALKSDRKSHQKLARSLLVERDTFRPNSPMTERLIRKATALHDTN